MLTPIIPKIRKKREQITRTFRIEGIEESKLWIESFNPSDLLIILKGLRTLKSLKTFIAATSYSEEREKIESNTIRKSN